MTHFYEEKTRSDSMTCLMTTLLWLYDLRIISNQNVLTCGLQAVVDDDALQLVSVTCTWDAIL